MYCKHCGQEIDINDTFCGNCGKAINAPKNTFKQQPELSQGKTSSKKTMIIVAISIVCVFALILIFVCVSCSKNNLSNKLTAHQWENNHYTYKFFENGTYKYVHDVWYDGTGVWRIDGNKLIMDEEDEYVFNKSITDIAITKEEYDDKIYDDAPKWWYVSDQYVIIGSEFSASGPHYVEATAID